MNVSRNQYLAAFVASLAAACSPPADFGSPYSIGEDTTEITGEVSVSVADTFEGESSTVYHITDDSGIFTQIVSGNADIAGLVTGDVVHVSGIVGDVIFTVNGLDVLSAAPRPSEYPPEEQPQTAGGAPVGIVKSNRTVLVIPLYHDGDPRPIPNNAQINTALTAAFNYFQKNSPASLAFTLNMFPPMRSGYSAATGIYGSFPPMGLFASNAYLASAVNGVNAAVYDHVVLVGNMACAPAPAGYVTRAQGDLGGRNLYLCPDLFPYFKTNPDDAAAVVTHEMGHNFGLNHSAQLKCGNKVYGASAAECTAIKDYEEYSNQYDIMGNGTLDNWLNAINRELLGWITLTYVGSDGVYPLNATEAYGTIRKGIRIRTPSNIYYYIEYRKLGQRTAGKQDLEGVLIHTQVPGFLKGPTSNVSTVVLDMTPNRSIPVVLPFNTVYKDPSGIQISAARVDADNVNVTIRTPPKIVLNWGQPNPMPVAPGPATTVANISTAPVETSCDLAGIPSGPATQHSFSVYHDLAPGESYDYPITCAEAADPENTESGQLQITAGTPSCSLTINGQSSFVTIPVGGVATLVVDSNISGSGTWVGTNNDQPIDPAPQGPAPGQWSFQIDSAMTGSRAMVISGPGGTCTTNTVVFSVE